MSPAISTLVRRNEEQQNDVVSCYEFVLYDHHLANCRQSCIRKTKSLSDISAYERYCNHVRNHLSKQGILFTTKNFISILKSEFKSFKTKLCPPAVLNPPARRRLMRSTSDASSSDSKRSMLQGILPSRRRSYKLPNMTAFSSTEDSDSACNSPSPYRSSFLRKVCNDTKTYVKRMCNTPEKIPLPAKYQLCHYSVESYRHKMNCLDHQKTNRSLFPKMFSPKSKSIISHCEEDMLTQNKMSEKPSTEDQFGEKKIQRRSRTRIGDTTSCQP